MRAGIALGSNVGDRLANLRSGRAATLRLPDVNAPAISSRIYETEPIGTALDAGAFLNAVVEVEFDGHPMALLDALQEIEKAHGRPSKRPRNASRALDLDILYVGNLVLTNEEIVIPHPRMHLRRFVLTPLKDIRPDLILPGQHQTIAQFLAALSDSAAVELFASEW